MKIKHIIITLLIILAIYGIYYLVTNISCKGYEIENPPEITMPTINR